MTEDERALFRAKMFDRAARAMLGLPDEPVEAAGDAAASEPQVREVETDEDHNDGR